MAIIPETPFDQGLARLIDYTLLRPDATAAEINQLCQEALAYQFWSVCVNPCWVPLAVELLRHSEVKVTTVIGFPLGATTTAVKALEAGEAINYGAQELDMVLNLGAFKSEQYEVVARDIQVVVQVAQEKALLKVILETGFLTEAEKVRAAELSKALGANFVKTATGFGPGGATVFDVELLRRTVGVEMGVKAAGGINDYATARAMIDAGADRIGSSAGVAIVTKK